VAGTGVEELLREREAALQRARLLAIARRIDEAVAATPGGAARWCSAAHDAYTDRLGALLSSLCTAQQMLRAAADRVGIERVAHGAEAW
jgi:hypothetical protein